MSTPEPVPQPDNIAMGVFWMVGTTFWFVLLDTCAKYLMQFYPVLQVVWARFFFHTLFVLLFIGLIHRVKITSNRLPLQILRSILMLLTTTLFFLGIRDVQLATASSIMFMSPIIVTLLAIPLLGEKVGVRRLVGVLIGFCGALIVIRPGADSFKIGMLFLLACALTNAFYQINTRKIRAWDDPFVSLLFTGVVGALVTSVAVPFVWQSPVLIHWPLFLFMGLAGGIGHFCLIKAFRVAPASSVAPFNYTGLLWSTLAGFLVFGDLPDRFVLLGAALIIVSGVYIFHRERVRGSA